MDGLRNDYRQTLSLARPLLSELSSWHERVRAPAQYEDDTSSSFIFSNLASLELGYHSVQLLIFRAILRSFRSDISVVQEQEAPEWKSANAQSRNAAKNAIIAAHNFAASLSTKQFQPFWAPCKLSFVYHRIFSTHSVPCLVVYLTWSNARDSNVFRHDVFDLHRVDCYIKEQC